MRTLCIIPARSGSKRLPGKNWAPFGMTDLVGRAINCAKEAGLEPVLVTDDAGAARRYSQGCDVMKEPTELAADDARMVDVAGWVLSEREAGIEFDAVVILQPTSPLRTEEDVRSCLDALDDNGLDSVVSMVGVKEGKHVRYEHNGAVYVTSPYLVARGEIVGGLTGFYVMPPERSIDIDTQEDLDRAREIWERTHG